jgi:hypothetical protein
MTRVRVVVVTAVLLAVALVASGCSGSGDDDAEPRGTRDRAEQAGVTDGSGLSEDDLITALADAGIGSYEAPGTTEPIARVTDAGPMKLLRDQVAVMALQTREGTGTVGARLDGLVGQAPDGGAPFSLVIAAYVQAGDTEGADLARRIMGEQPWAQAESLVFPDVVLALFADDAARAALAERPTGLRSPVGAPVVEAAPQLVGEVTGICSALHSWIDSIIKTVVDALKVDTSGGGITGFLGDIWNAVVDLAVEAAGKLVKTLTAPVVDFIKKALAVVGTLSLVASILKPWNASAEQKPNPAAYGVDPGEGNPVEVVATVDTGKSIPFSDTVIDCAKQAGVSLPDPKSATGSKITWEHTGIDAVGTGIEKDEEIGKDNTASLRFTTRTESKEAATKGTAVAHPIAVTVKVDRTQVKELQKLLLTVLLGAVPGPAVSITATLFDVITKPIFDELASLLGTSGAGAGVVISHDPPEPDPDTDGDATDECAGLAAGAIPDGTWTGPVDLVVDGNIASGTGAMTSTGSGTLTMTVAKGKVTKGEWTLDFVSKGQIKMPSGSGRSDGINVAITGAVFGPASAPRLSADWKANGLVTVTVQGFTVDSPVDVAGSAEVGMTVEESDCAEVTGTFIPSFNENASGVAFFTGKARWTGEAA